MKDSKFSSRPFPTTLQARSCEERKGTARPEKPKYRSTPVNVLHCFLTRPGPNSSVGEGLTCCRPREVVDASNHERLFCLREGCNQRVLLHTECFKLWVEQVKKNEQMAHRVETAWTSSHQQTFYSSRDVRRCPCDQGVLFHPALTRPEENLQGQGQESNGRSQLLNLRPFPSTIAYSNQCQVGSGRAGPFDEFRNRSGSLSSNESSTISSIDSPPAVCSPVTLPTGGLNVGSAGQNLFTSMSSVANRNPAEDCPPRAMGSNVLGSNINPIGSNVIPPHVIGSNANPSHVIGLNGNQPHAIGSNVNPIDSNMNPPHVIKSNLNPSHAIGSNIHVNPPHVIGSNVNPTHAIGSNVNHPLPTRSNMNQPHVIGSNMNPHGAIGSNVNLLGGLGWNVNPPQMTGSNVNPHGAIGSNVNQSPAIGSRLRPDKMTTITVDQSCSVTDQHGLKRPTTANNPTRGTSQNLLDAVRSLNITQNASDLVGPVGPVNQSMPSTSAPQPSSSPTAPVRLPYSKLFTTTETSGNAPRRRASSGSNQPVAPAPSSVAPPPRLAAGRAPAQSSVAPGSMAPARGSVASGSVTPAQSSVASAPCPGRAPASGLASASGLATVREEGAAAGQALPKLDLGNIFHHRQDFTAFHGINMRSLNTHVVRTTDEGPHGNDDIRSTVLRALSHVGMKSIPCAACSDLLVIYDQYPLVNGSFFLSRITYGNHAPLEVTLPRRQRARTSNVAHAGSWGFLNAICLACMGMYDRPRILCRACGQYWSARHCTIGSVYAYDLFASQVCCPNRILCTGCRRPALVYRSVYHPPQQQGPPTFGERIEALSYSDFSQMWDCECCGVRDHHAVKQLGGILFLENQAP